jgi:hypothetical protein
VLNLSNWKLTLPLSDDGEVKEILQPQLAKFEQKPFFYTDTGVGVVFRAPVNGFTTSGSKYPRSELRQMKNNGRDRAAWSNKSQAWTMECDLAFTHLPGGKPHVVGMQIHGGSDDVTVLRLEGTSLYITEGDNKKGGPILTGYKLGRRLNAKVVAQKGGGFRWYLNNVAVGSVVYPGKTFSGCYFKTGCYTQANEDNGSGYGETILYSTKISVS